MEAYDFQFQIVILGDSGVGKSTLMSMYLNKQFVERHNDRIREGFKDLLIGDKKIRLQLLDTSGKEPFRSVSWAFFRNCIGILLVFDLTSRDSFDNLRKWYEEINNFSKPEYKVISLVCNKADMLEAENIEKHWISFEEGEQFAVTHSMNYFVTSSKLEGISKIEEIFLRMSEEILVLKESKGDDQELQGITSSNETLQKNNIEIRKKSNRSGCC